MIHRYNPDLHHRRSIRLKGYDYAQTGLCFVTVCTQNRECLFGEVIEGEMRLNEGGRIVQEEWLKTAAVRPYVPLDESVVMPNHFHGILMILDQGRGTARRAPTRGQFGKPISGSLSTITRAFKSAVTKRINDLRNTPAIPVWQRGYYDHIVRDEDELNRIREYIALNPARWAEDKENPMNQRATDMAPIQTTTRP